MGRLQRIGTTEHLVCGPHVGDLDGEDVGGAGPFGAEDQERGLVPGLAPGGVGAPEGGKPVLISLDDAETLFHEFGHALHGMLSDVTYPLLAGTAVPSDFVELPSQIYEHWLSRPEILGRFAVHERTGEPMPKALLNSTRERVNPVPVF